MECESFQIGLFDFLYVFSVFFGEWKVTDGYKVKADELSWEELKNATENVIEEKRKSHRIVVLDGYGLNPGDLSWEGIERMGEFTVYDRTSVDEIVSRAALADIVLTNKTPLSATTLEQLPHLRYIDDIIPSGRSEERRVGKECTSVCRSRWSPYH